MSAPIIIGICGYKGSGKSEIRKYLVSRYGFTSIALADPLKAMLRAIGISEEQLNGSLKETPCNQLQGQTPRHAMQTLGTEWGRMMVGSDLWINAWKDRVTQCRTPVITDDLRFVNEFDLLRSLGGKTLRVTRNGTGPTGHISETEASEIEVDYGITNNGRLIDLHSSVDRAIQYFRFSRSV